MNPARPFETVRRLRHSRSGLSTTAIVLIILGVVFVAFLIMGAVLVALLYPAITEARRAAQGVQARNNLKQIGLAMHNYHDVYRQLPPGGIYVEGDSNGRHGWMTSILPYLEQNALFDGIDFNQHWNSEQNAPVFMNPIPTYQHPEYQEGPSEVFTTTNGFATAHFAGNSEMLLNNGSLRFRDVADGLSNTAMAGQVGAGFQAWGDPENRRSLATGFGSTPDQFGTMTGKTVQILMGDGSVRSVSVDTDPQTLKHLGTPAGGEVLGQF